ncbi:WecB/TagA/CpsF family glycosyltransferase [Lederbergia graminis]|uniref:N-acetylglucosaminyldiphosphoundecaprenol N-acetyl-beta-D-mannosaminyltransferase n=1 Tax=Lederbergia graminis TaxID=735518 RepID=A0ABW0LL60_9BACI
MEKLNILGVPFDHTTMEDMFHQLRHNLQLNKKTFIVTANPEIVMYAVEDEHYRNTIAQANHIIADGAGIILASKLVKKPLPERVAGFDLMVELLKLANKEQLRVFFLGSREQVIERTVANVQKSYPNLQIAGYHHGFFKENDETVTEMVKNSNPDMVFVALGFPKQEYWIQNNYHHFEKGIFMGVGGSFEIIAGTAKRAPDIWIKLNLEWLHRLLSQPSRWRRMLALPKFVIRVLKTRKRQ